MVACANSVTSSEENDVDIVSHDAHRTPHPCILC